MLWATEKTRVVVVVLQDCQSVGKRGKKNESLLKLCAYNHSESRTMFILKWVATWSSADFAADYCMVTCTYRGQDSRDPCLTGAPNVWSDYWHFWQLLISFCCVPGFQDGRCSIGFVSCGRRTHDRAVRGTMRKGYWSPIEEADSPQGGWEFSKHICSWWLLYCFVWKVLCNIPFSVGRDIQLLEPCCVVMYTLTSLCSDPVISCSHWLQVPSL